MREKDQRTELAVAASDKGMARPTFLVAEPEAEQAISARKLVLETAKFNVITAHSSQEAVEFAKKFPNVDATILHARMAGEEHVRLCELLRTILPGKKLIAISPSTAEVPAADYHVDSHDPQELLNLLRQLFGDPRSMEKSGRSAEHDLT